MGHFKFKQHKESIDTFINTLHADAEKEQESIQKNSLTITGDSKTISGLPIQTPAYTKWLVSQQQRNPFIGKDYIMDAPEYSADSEVIETNVIDEKDATNILQYDTDGQAYISDDYDPNNTAVDDGPEDDATTTKFKEYCLISTMVSKRIGFDFNNIMDDIKDELLNINGENFVFPDDLENTVKLCINNEETKLRLTKQ